MRGSIDMPYLDPVASAFRRNSASEEASAFLTTGAEAKVVGRHDPAGLESLVCAAAARALRLPAEAVGPDVPFARLGLDSLGCLELAGELEAALGIHVPPDAVVECTTVRSLCATLGNGDTAESIAGRNAESTIDRMRADAGLAADLRPRPFIGALSLLDARQILLTGATGFLGSALLDALLERTTAHVTCLVRPPAGARSPFAQLVVPGLGFCDLAPAKGRYGDLAPGKGRNGDLTPGKRRNGDLAPRGERVGGRAGGPDVAAGRAVR